MKYAEDLTKLLEVQGTRGWFDPNKSTLSKEELCRMVKDFLNGRDITEVNISKTIAETEHTDSDTSTLLEVAQHARLFCVDDLYYVLTGLEVDKTGKLVLCLADNHHNGKTVKLREDDMDMGNCYSLITCLGNYFKGLVYYDCLYNTYKDYYACKDNNSEVMDLYINELTSTLSPYIKRMGDMGDYIKPIIETMIITHIHSLIDDENYQTVVPDSVYDDEVYYTFELDCEIASDTSNVYKFPKNKMDKINKDSDFHTTRLFDEEETDKITGEVKKKLLRIYRNEQKKKRLKRS